MPKTALVTGGNRGIGLEVCRQLSRAGFAVLLGCRDLKAGQHAAQNINEAGPVTAVELDVRNQGQVDAVTTKPIDILVNNAGIYDAGSFSELGVERLQQSLEVNLFGAFRLISAVLPAMNAAGSGRIINVSSGDGSLSDGLPGPCAYAMSKAALNALTLATARNAVGEVEINSVCPGWVRTDMGGAYAPRDVAQGADTVVWLATREGERINGKFLRDRTVIPW